VDIAFAHANAIVRPSVANFKDCAGWNYSKHSFESCLERERASPKAALRQDPEEKTLRQICRACVAPFHNLPFAKRQSSLEVHSY